MSVTVKKEKRSKTYSHGHSNINHSKLKLYTCQGYSYHNVRIYHSCNSAITVCDTLLIAEFFILLCRLVASSNAARRFVCLNTYAKVLFDRTMHVVSFFLFCLPIYLVLSELSLSHHEIHKMILQLSHLLGMKRI